MHLFKTSLLSLAAFGPLALTAQQTMPFTQFWTTQLQTNPATAGLHYKHHAYMAYSQDNSSYGNQTGAYTGYAMKIDRIHSGAGISYAFDGGQNGTTYSQAAMLHYAYQFNLGGSTLATGVSGGVRIHSLDWDKLTFGDLIAPEEEYDPVLTDRGGSRTAFDASAGIAYNWKELNVGVSVTQLTRPVFVGNLNTVPLYWLTADYTFHLPARIDLRPQVQVMTDNVKWYHMASLMAVYANKLWIGANYRYDHQLGGMIGYDLKERYRIGLGYNVHTNSALDNDLNTSSFQFVLSWMVK